MTIADDIALIKSTVLALQSTPPVASVDLSPALTAIADVKSDTTFIKTELTPTP